MRKKQAKNVVVKSRDGKTPEMEIAPSDLAKMMKFCHSASLLEKKGKRFSWRRFTPSPD